MTKYGFFALKGGDWEEYKSIFKVEVKAAEWAFERIREASEKYGKIEHCTRNYVEEYRFPAAYHCASKRTRRCHDVIFMPKLQRLSPGRLRVVGFRWEEALQLVVRDLWRRT